MPSTGNDLIIILPENTSWLSYSALWCQRGRGLGGDVDPQTLDIYGALGLPGAGWFSSFSVTFLMTSLP